MKIIIHPTKQINRRGARINMKENIMITHGKVTHPLSQRLDCMSCLEVEIDFLNELRKVGGQTKFLKRLKKGIENNGT